MKGLEIEKMEWDSDFWNIDIYNAKKSKNTNKEVFFNREAKNEKYLIQTLISIEDINFINFLEDNHFHFKENKITFAKTVNSKVSSLKNISFNEIDENDVVSYKNSFYDLFGKVTRYNLFSKEKINQFYLSWAVKSSKGLLDDKCIGIFKKGKLSGFITYKIKNNTMIIGLLGVFPEYQGSKLGLSLLNYVNNIAFNNNYEKIYISTQGKNMNAINTYISNGYYVDSIDHWYYLSNNIEKE